MVYLLHQEKGEENMFETITEKYLKEKKVYILTDCGWYYDREILCVEDEAEAITAWEKLTKTPFTTYQKHLDSADYMFEGHWYYSLESTTLWDIFQKELATQKEKTIREEAEQIRALGNQMIQVSTYREIKKEFTQAFDGAIHYLTKTIGYSPALWREEREKAFEEGLKKT